MVQMCVIKFGWNVIKSYEKGWGRVRVILKLFVVHWHQPQALQYNSFLKRKRMTADEPKGASNAPQ